MWQRGKGRSRRGASNRSVWPQALLWALLAIETAWLALFMLSAGSPLPPQADRWLARPGKPADAVSAAQQNRLATQEDQATELELKHLLAKKGSQGAAGPPPPPAK